MEKEELEQEIDRQRLVISIIETWVDQMIEFADKYDNMAIQAEDARILMLYRMGKTMGHFDMEDPLARPEAPTNALTRALAQELIPEPGRAEKE